MAMNGNTMGDAIKSAIDGLTAEQKQDPTTIWRTIATAIVSHIAANAVTSTGNVQGGADTRTGTIT